MKTHFMLYTRCRRIVVKAGNEQYDHEVTIKISKLLFTQGKICLHRSNRGGRDYILGDPKAIHRSHTKPDIHDEWDIEIIMLVNWSRTVTQKT